MLFGAWLLIGLIATAAALATGYLALDLTPEDDAAVIVSGTIGFVAWGVWTYGALNLERPIEGNASLTFSEPAIALVGLAFAVMCGVLALTGPIEAISRVDETRLDDV